MKIPIFKLHFEDKFITTFQRKAADLLQSNRPLSEDIFVKEFEEKFAELVGAKYAIAVTNGTAAIELALKAIGVRGTTVLMPSNTFFATSVAATNAGAEVDLLEAEEENFSIDPVSLEKTIKEYKVKKKKIGAVIIVHIGGIITKHIREIKKICEQNNIPLIEDAAHAHCSRYGSFKAGTIGKIGCFSFFPTKSMTTGEGGMVTTNDKKIYDLVRSLKNFGRDNSNGGIIVNHEGNNFKMTELTALLGVLECGRVLKRIKKRNQLTDMYVRRLKNSGYKAVLQEKGLSAQYKMIIRIPIDYEWLRNYCKDHGISLTGEVYKIPVHMQPLYREKFKNKKLPITERIAATHICPPLYPELTAKEINYICDILLTAEKDYEK